MNNRADALFAENTNATREFSYYDAKAGQVPFWVAQPSGDEQRGAGGAPKGRKKKKDEEPMYVHLKKGGSHKMAKKTKKKSTKKRAGLAVPFGMPEGKGRAMAGSGMSLANIKKAVDMHMSGPVKAEVSKILESVRNKPELVEAAFMKLVPIISQIAQEVAGKAKTGGRRNPIEEPFDPWADIESPSIMGRVLRYIAKMLWDDLKETASGVATKVFGGGALGLAGGALGLAGGALGLAGQRKMNLAKPPRGIKRVPYKEQSMIVGAGCAKVGHMVGEGLRETLKRHFTHSKDEGTRAFANASKQFMSKLNDVGLFKDFKERMCEEAPKFKKHLPAYAAAMATAIMTRLGVPQVIRESVEADIKRFLLSQARSMSLGKMCGGGKVWNKIKGLVKKVKNAIKNSTAGRFIGKVAKLGYNTAVPGIARRGVKELLNTELGKRGVKYVDEGTN